MSEHLEAPCPGCGRILKYPGHAVGKSVRCRKCGTIWRATAGHTTDSPDPSPRAGADTGSRTAAQTRHLPRRPVPVAPPAASLTAKADLPRPGPLTLDLGQSTPATAAIIAAPPRRRRSNSWLTWVFAFSLIGFCIVLAGGTIWWVRHYWLAAANTDRDFDGGLRAGATADDESQARKPTTDFPRRLLAIGVHNYIFANPTSYGFDPAGLIKRDFGKTVEKLASRFRIPESQVFELSDGAPPPRRKIPLKPIIEQTLQRFVDTSRRQDRIIVLLCAHTIEIEGKPYVVPLEGELTDPNTLIPLESILQKLGECRAQQKVLIADFNRYDRGRGVELPHGGRLGANTAKMLKNPPPGVQVWSACSEGEYSYEFDDYFEFRDHGRIQGIKGGAFLCMFSVAFMQGAGGKIQTPNDPLPLESLAEKVNEYTKRLSEELDEPDDGTSSNDGDKDDKPTAPKNGRRVKQTPFLLGSPLAEAVPFDGQEPPPEPIVIPTPRDVFGGEMASAEEVRRIVDFFALPPIKEARKDSPEVRFDEILPFRAERLSDYRAGMTADQVRREAERYPFRAAIVDAIEELRKLDSGEGALPATLTEADRSDAAKAAFARMQRGPARVMHVLEELAAKLERVAAERENEKSKFWRATFDYLQAQIRARHIYVNEYTSAFGIVRRDRLPAIDPAKGHVGWRLASRETLSTNDNAIKEMRKELRKIYDGIIRDHPDTPWAVLAKRERNIALGLRWEPFARPKSEQVEAISDAR